LYAGILVHISYKFEGVKYFVTWLKYLLCMVTEICASLQWNICMLVIPLGNISSKVNKKIKFSSYLFEKKTNKNDILS
jgi:hypothetical protein